MTARVQDLLRGNAPTDEWLATNEAASVLSDADTRTSLYRAMHPRADVAHVSLLRALLAHEVAFRADPANDHDDRFENLYWCGLLLSQLGDVGDVMRLWRAKRTNFDTGSGFGIQLVVGPGVDATLAFLDGSRDSEAAKAAAYIRSCAKAGDFDNLEAWVAHRRAYFGPR